MSAEQIQLLKQFVQLCKENPTLLHKPQFQFYRDFLESMGAKVPPLATEEKAPEASQPKTSTETKETYEEQQEEEEPEPELTPPELDNTDVIEDKTGEEEYPMGDPNKDISEEDMEKADEYREIAAAAFNEGDYQKAVENYTKAIELNPGSAILHAKRANTLLKMSKLTAAIKDCDKAIAINPDSAAPYKFRGRAHRLMGNWMEAHKDLAISCKLDYDDTAYEWLKEVEPNAKKLQEYQRTKERLAEEKELRARRERVRRAQEEKKRHGSGGDEEIGGGGGSGMGAAFADIFKDPELLEALKKDPSLAQKMAEIMTNPANIMKHMNDPNVQKLLSKLGANINVNRNPDINVKVNVSEPTFSFGKSADENPGASNRSAGNVPPKKAPEPDLD